MGKWPVFICFSSAEFSITINLKCPQPFRPSYASGLERMGLMNLIGGDSRMKICAFIIPQHECSSESTEPGSTTKHRTEKKKGKSGNE
jgi:hypothetical protein